MAPRSTRPDVSLRRVLRAVTPGMMRVAVARVRRLISDSGVTAPRPRFAARPRIVAAAGFPHDVIAIVQEIRPTGFLEGKLANLRLGAARLDGVVVAPGETFSFWVLVGPPSAAAGFEVGRSIRGGAVGGEIGGGLCQVSGIAYEAGLRAGLGIVERHPHSRDLYGEGERFTPLGLDATVVWPYRDLRLLNPFAAPVQFRFAVEGLTLTASVHAPVPLEPAALDIARTDRDGWREVRVVRRRAWAEAEPISDDLYPAPPVEGGEAEPGPD